MSQFPTILPQPVQAAPNTSDAQVFEQAQGALAQTFGLAQTIAGVARQQTVQKAEEDAQDSRITLATMQAQQEQVRRDTVHAALQSDELNRRYDKLRDYELMAFRTAIASMEPDEAIRFMQENPVADLRHEERIASLLGERLGRRAIESMYAKRLENPSLKATDIVDGEIAKWRLNGVHPAAFETASRRLLDHAVGIAHEQTSQEIRRRQAEAESHAEDETKKDFVSGIDAPQQDPMADVQGGVTRYQNLYGQNISEGQASRLVAANLIETVSRISANASIPELEKIQSYLNGVTGEVKRTLRASGALERVDAELAGARKTAYSAAVTDVKSVSENLVERARAGIDTRAESEALRSNVTSDQNLPPEYIRKALDEIDANAATIDKVVGEVADARAYLDSPIPPVGGQKSFSDDALNTVRQDHLRIGESPEEADAVMLDRVGRISPKSHTEIKDAFNPKSGVFDPSVGISRIAALQKVNPEKARQIAYGLGQPSARWAYDWIYPDAGPGESPVKVAQILSSEEARNRITLPQSDYDEKGRKVYLPGEKGEVQSLNVLRSPRVITQFRTKSYADAAKSIGFDKSGVTKEMLGYWETRYAWHYAQETSPLASDRDVAAAASAGDDLAAAFVATSGGESALGMFRFASLHALVADAVLPRRDGTMALPASHWDIGSIAAPDAAAVQRFSEALGSAGDSLNGIPHPEASIEVNGRHLIPVVGENDLGEETTLGFVDIAPGAYSHQMVSRTSQAGRDAIKRMQTGNRQAVSDPSGFIRRQQGESRSIFDYPTRRAVAEQIARTQFTRYLGRAPQRTFEDTEILMNLIRGVVGGAGYDIQ